MEATEQNISRICHKIYFPNDTSEVSLCPRDLALPAPGPSLGQVSMSLAT